MTNRRDLEKHCADRVSGGVSWQYIFLDVKLDTWLSGLYDGIKRLNFLDYPRTMSQQLSTTERQLMLELARYALDVGVRGQTLPALELEQLPEKLQAPGATFVTLTIEGKLRGCIGTLEPKQPLAQDVREHAIAAALHDYRFPPVNPDELEQIEIEISRLTPLKVLEYKNSQDLLSKLQLKQDGVLVRDGFRRATFLPQVWDKLDDPAVFMDHLCQKMGVEPNYWRYHKLDVYTYQVEEFCEQPG